MCEFGPFDGTYERYFRCSNLRCSSSFLYPQKLLFGCSEQSVPAPSSLEEKKGFLAKSSGLNQASPARFECWRRERDRVYNLGLPGGFATRVGGKSGLL